MRTSDKANCVSELRLECFCARQSLNSRFEILLANFLFLYFIYSMNIQNHNGISFQSNIHFVSFAEFDKQMFRNFFYCQGAMRPLNESMLKGKDIWTSSIRTCSAGGIVDNQGALGFHFFNSLENIQKVKDNLFSIIKKKNGKAKSALLIGGKRIDGIETSLKLFDTVLDKLHKFVQPSYFKVYKNMFAESDLGYDKRSDSWFINLSLPVSENSLESREDVLTLKKLKECFEKIKIAPQDKLYIAGKEVKRREVPEWFC